jgi:Tol biopolymer transport system component
VQEASARADAGEVFFSARAYSAPSGLQGLIAFASGNGRGSDEIQVANADGTGRRRLSTSGDYDPAWSPDGSRLAFVSERDGAPSIYVMAADGSSVTRRTRGPYDTSPAWSPDGSTIAFAGRHDGSLQIATVGVADTSVVLLTRDPGYEGQPSWSPDGRQLAYVSDWLAYDYASDIYTIYANGTGLTRRTYGLGPFENLVYSLHPVWSPDGSMIAFVHGTIINESDMRFNVAIMSASGGFIRDLAWAGDIPWVELLDPGSLAWSPDGRGIAYTFLDCDLLHRSGCTKTRSVRYVSVDGSEQGTIVTDAHSPSWKR